MSDAGGTLTYGDVGKLTKRLPPSVLARFETVSGVVVLNMPKESYLASVQRYGTGNSGKRDRKLIQVLNHETCHFIQCLSSGYMVWRTRHLWRAFNSRRNMSTQLRMQWLMATSRARHWVLDLFFRKAEDGKGRAGRMAQFMYVNNRQVLINRIIGDGPRTQARLDLPRFFAVLDGVRAAEKIKGPEGVSTLGIIEAAAVFYGTTYEVYRWPEAEQRAHFDAEFAKLPPLYSELWTFVTERAGDRALCILLPLAAVAMQYRHPQHAVGPLLERMLAIPEASFDTDARALFDAPPRLPKAGRRLEPAQAFRDKRNRVRLYDTHVDAMRADPNGLDDYRLLTDPLFLYSYGSYPVCLTFSDKTFTATAGHMDEVELAARVLIAGLVLEVKSLARDGRNAEIAMGNYFRGVINANFAPIEDSPGSDASEDGLAEDIDAGDTLNVPPPI